MRVSLVLPAIALAAGFTGAIPQSPEGVKPRDRTSAFTGFNPVVSFTRLETTDGPEETLHYDGPNDDALGLTRGGTFFCAARFTPSLPCSLKAIVFYHSDPSRNGMAFVYGPGTDTTPGAILDSAAYPGSTTGWLRVNLAAPRYLTSDADFWVSVRCTHDSDFFPMGIDAGPMVPNRGGFFSANGAMWVQMTRLGMDVNANIRAVIVRGSVNQDLGVKRVITPRGYVGSGPVAPVAVVKNFGLQAVSSAGVRLFIDPGSYTSFRTITGLNPGDTVRVTFDNWTPPFGGFFAVRCTTELAGDMNPANDRMTETALTPTIVQDFETSNGGYVADCYPSPGWVWGTPASPRPAPYSGTKVWGAPLSGDYVDNADWNLYSCIYQAALDSPAIAFYHWYHIEQGPDGGNFCYSLDTGRTWNFITPWTAYSPPYDEFVYSLGTDGYTGTRLTNWTIALFRIPVPDGTPFQLRWRLASDASTGDKGWMIDDVAGIGVVLASGIADRTAGRHPPAALCITPNPCSGTALVAYSVPVAGSIRLELYDITGALVTTLTSGYHNAGASSFIVHRSSFARGVYLLRLELEAGGWASPRLSLSQKLILE
jgi:hypothetical protein